MRRIRKPDNRRNDLYEAVKAYKVGKGCRRCGIRDHRVLDFHHLRDKKEKISSMVYFRRPLKEIMIEMAKCEILCANCHRLEHCK